MKEILKAWDHFWFKRIDPVSFAIARIYLGALISLYYLCLYENWARFYGFYGTVSYSDGPQNRLLSLGWTIFEWTPDRISMQILWWICFLSALCFTAGLKTRLFNFILYFMISSQIHRNTMACNGEDLLFRMLLFWGIFAPWGNDLSVDSRLRKRKNPPPATSFPMIWAVRGMQINFVLIYAITLPLKFQQDAAWWTGDAVYLAIVSDQWSRWPWPEMFYAANGILSRLMTYATALLEGAFTLFIWLPVARLQMALVIALATLHIGISVMLKGCNFFSLSMLAGLWLFVPPPYGRWLVDNLHRDIRVIGKTKRQP